MSKTIYIAGPMRGFKYYNFHIFDAVEAYLKSAGYNVINPAQLDRDAGFDACDLPEDYDWSSDAPITNLVDIVRRDIEAIFKADAIYLLKGWEKSVGAQAEYWLAKWLNKEILYQEDNMSESLAVTKVQNENADTTETVTFMYAGGTINKTVLSILDNIVKSRTVGAGDVDEAWDKLIEEVDQWLADYNVKTIEIKLTYSDKK